MSFLITNEPAGVRWKCGLVFSFCGCTFENETDDIVECGHWIVAEG